MSHNKLNKVQKTLLLAVLLSFCIVDGLGVHLGASSETQQTLNELISSYKAFYGDYYAEDAGISLETLCDSLSQIYSAFGSDSLKPYESCSRTLDLLGSSNSAFGDSTPDCYANVEAVFCSFEMNYDGIPISTAVFDFIVNSISRCMKQSEDSTQLTSCPGLDIKKEMITDGDTFCTQLERKADFSVGNDDSMVSADVSPANDTRRIYKSIPEDQYDECRHVVESFNYCVFMKRRMGATTVKDCYDKYFELYSDLHIKKYNRDMKEMCSNVILPTFIYYARRQEILAPGLKSPYELLDLTILRVGNMYSFCDTVGEKNSKAIDSRLNGLAARKQQNIGNVTALKGAATKLQDFEDVIIDSTEQLLSLQTAFGDFFGNITKNGSDQIQVRMLVQRNIELLNTSLVQLSAYTQIFKINSTNIEGTVGSQVVSITSSIDQIVQLMNISTELCLFASQAISEDIEESDINAGNPNSNANYNDVATIERDSIVKLNNLFAKSKENFQEGLTRLNVLKTNELKDSSIEINRLAHENVEIEKYIDNLNAQQTINGQLIAKSV